MVSCTGSKTPDEVDVDQESTGLGCWHFSFNPFFVGRPGAAQKPTKMLSRRCREKNDTIIPRLMREVAVLSAGENAIDLSTAENWLMRHDLIENVRSNGGWELPLAQLSYPGGIGGCPQAKASMAALLNHYFSPSTTVVPSHIVLTAGASFALDALIEQICDPGDSVMIAAPYWSGLDISISVHNEARVLQVNVPLDKFFDLTSIDYYEDAFKSNQSSVKALLVCNPHNPLGRCYGKRVLQGLLDFCSRNNLHFISDELYALSIHKLEEENGAPPRFVSALSLTGTSNLVHVVYSLSKDFGCSGIRMGAVISQHNSAICLGVALDTHGQVSTLSNFIAVQSILNEKTVTQFVAKNGRLLRAAYATLEQFLVERNIEFVPAHAGVYIFARLSPYNDISWEQALLQQLKINGVCLASGTNYHYDQPGWVRISYALPPAMVAEGLQRIDDSLKALREARNRLPAR